MFVIRFARAIAARLRLFAPAIFMSLACLVATSQKAHAAIAPYATEYSALQRINGVLVLNWFPTGQQACEAGLSINNGTSSYGTEVEFRDGWCYANSNQYWPPGRQWVCPANSEYRSGLCYCKTGFLEQGLLCVATQPLQIALLGASRTKALAAGPVLPQIARLSGGASVAGKAVSIRIKDGGAIDGVTDSNGEFRFLYVPPWVAKSDVLTGTCAECSNTATKSITVEPCDVCERP